MLLWTCQCLLTGFSRLYLRVKLLHHLWYICACFTTLQPNHFPKWLYPFLVLPAVFKLHCFTFSSTCDIVRLFSFCQTSGCKMVSHCDFNLYFPNYWRDCTPFHIFMVIMFPLLEIIFNVFTHFFPLIFCFDNLDLELQKWYREFLYPLYPASPYVNIFIFIIEYLPKLRH